MPAKLRKVNLLWLAWAIALGGGIIVLTHLPPTLINLEAHMGWTYKGFIALLYALLGCLIFLGLKKPALQPRPNPYASSSAAAPEDVCELSPRLRLGLALTMTMLVALINELTQPLAGYSIHPAQLLAVSLAATLGLLGCYFATR